MTATEWKNKGRAAAEAEAVDLELPSGMTIKARRPEPLTVAMWGQLPLGLAAAVGPAGTGQEARPTADVMAGLALARDILTYCCVTPRLSLNPAGEGEIHPRDIPPEDVMFILRWARRGEEAEALRSFRDERQAAGSGGDGGTVRTTAIDAAWHRGPLTSAGIGPRGLDGDPNGAE